MGEMLRKLQLVLDCNLVLHGVNWGLSKGEMGQQLIAQRCMILKYVVKIETMF